MAVRREMSVSDMIPSSVHRASLAWSVPQVFQYLARRVVARHARDAAARVGRRARKVQSLDWRPVIGKAANRPSEERLVDREIAMVHMTSMQVEPELQLARGQDFAIDHMLAEPRRVALDQGQDLGQHFGSQRREAALIGLVNDVPAEYRDEMHPFGRQRVVAQARHHDSQEWRLRDIVAL